MSVGVRRYVGTALRLVVCAGLLWYVASQLRWSEVRAAVTQADWRWLVFALLSLAPVPFAMALRLRWLMNANGVELTLGRSVAITFVGTFANFVLPGQTGGDVLKAVLVARDTHRRHEAATVVLFDRVLGLICVVLLSGAMLLANWGDPALSDWGRPMGVAFACLILPGALYFSVWFRRLIRWEALLARLPLGEHLRRIDRAVWVYREHRLVVLRCMVLTWLLQAVAILATVLIGQAIGMASESSARTLKVYYLYVPLCWMAGALPISPQGIGVVEAAYKALLHDAAGFGTAGGAVVLSLLVRLANLVWALPGLAFYLKMGRPGSADRSRPGEAAGRAGVARCESPDGVL